MKRAIRNMAVVAGFFLLFAAAVGIAGAQRPTDQGADRDPRAGGPGRGGADQRPGGHGPAGELMGEFASRLAAKLGVSEDDLKSAFHETMQEMRPEIQERMQGARDRMREWRERRGGEQGDNQRGMLPFGMRPPMMPQGFGPGMGGGPGMPGMGGGPGMPGLAVVRVAADVLNMDPDALRQELQAGKTLGEIGQEHGVAPDALADQLVSHMEQMHSQTMREMVRAALDRQFSQP